MQRWSIFLWITVAAVVLPGCNHGSKQQPADDSPSVDRISQAQRTPPQQVAHGLVRLDKYQKFPFEVPPHVISPRLRGEFSSFMQGADGARISDESADVELMVMTEAQCDDFVHRRSAQAVDAVEPSHNHGVKITLPASQDEPVRYFVVFRRTTDAKNPVWIDADLTAEFDSSM
jgi:hypothetical protein